MYSHVYGLFIIAAQNLFMAIRYLPRWPGRPALSLRSWITLQTLLACLLLPWLFVLTAQIARVQTSFWIDEPDFADLVETLRLYMGVMPALLLGTIAAVIGLASLLGPTQDKLPAAARMAGAVSRYNAALLLLTWLLIPILLPFLISQILQPIYMPRYTIASSSAWYMLIAIGVGSLHFGWLRYGYLLLLVVALAGVLPVYYTANTKTDWPAAVAMVEDNADSGDLVLFHNPDVLVPYSYYHRRNDLVLHTVVPAETWQAAGVTDTRKPDVRELAQDYRQVWLVSGYDLKTAITELEIVNQLATVAVPRGGREFGAIRVFRYTAAVGRTARGIANPAKQ
jgi:hypothetical protein